MLDEKIYRQSYYAKILGVYVAELNILEVYFLNIIDFVIPSEKKGEYIYNSMENNFNVVGVIPARYASKRLPYKLLRPIKKPIAPIAMAAIIAST